MKRAREMRLEPNRILAKKRDKRRANMPEPITEKRRSSLHVLEHVAIWVAVVAFIFQAGWSLFIERPLQDEERIVRAWSLLTTTAPGNSGKGRAMSYLSSQNTSLAGLDLSCVPTDNGECTPQQVYDLDLQYEFGSNLLFVDFEQTEFIDPILGPTQITDANLNGALFERGRIASLSIVDSEVERFQLFFPDVGQFNMDGVRGAIRMQFSSLNEIAIWASSVDGSDIGLPPVENAVFELSSMKGSYLSIADFRNVSFHLNDLSGTRFACNEDYNCHEAVLAATRSSWTLPNQPILVSPYSIEETIIWEPLIGFNNVCNAPPTIINVAIIDPEDPRLVGFGTEEREFGRPLMKNDYGDCLIAINTQGKAELTWQEYVETGGIGYDVAEP